MHSRRFCGNMLTNQLMMDWLDIRSGGVVCIFTKQYLDEAMDTESVSGFNSLYDKDQVTTDSGEDETEDNPPSCGKRGRVKRKGGDDEFNKCIKTRSTGLTRASERLA